MSLASASTEHHAYDNSGESFTCASVFSLYYLFFSVLYGELSVVEVSKKKVVGHGLFIGIGFEWSQRAAIAACA